MLVSPSIVEKLREILKTDGIPCKVCAEIRDIVLDRVNIRRLKEIINFVDDRYVLRTEALVTLETRDVNPLEKRRKR